MPSMEKYDRKQRFNWYLQVDKYHKSVSEVCSVFNISRKTFYKWRNRDYGKRGNSYESGRMQPNLKLTFPVRKFIEERKLRCNYGPLKMKLEVKRELGLDVSTTVIYRYYKRKRLIRKPQRKFVFYEPLKYALSIKKPGQGVQMDVKYVYESRKRKYQFSVFDPFTKKYHFTIFKSKESVNAVIAFKAAQRYFGFKIVSIQTDNGTEFRGDFHSYLLSKNIPHYFIPKKSPWWNGSVERVHRTIDEEYYVNPKRIWKSPYEWLDYYNYERIHLSLGGITPQERLENVTLDC